MREAIINNMDNYGQLEKMYRENKTVFKKEFSHVYPVISEKPAAQFWHERLRSGSDEISWGTANELIFVIVAAFIAGLLAKIPDITGMSHEFFYPRNLAFVVFPFLTAYFAWKQNISLKIMVPVFAVFLFSAVYINLLPDTQSDTLILACIHLPLVLWSVLGFTFTAADPKNYLRRLDFLRFNGDLLVMSALIVISGALFTAITFGLFELIDIRIETFFSQYIAVWGGAAIPVVATYLVRTNPQLVNKVSPVIARVFTPLVFLTLTIYLVAVIYTGKDPYNDREFLMIFNLLLIGVMALILFSIVETSKYSMNKITLSLLLALSVVTIIINGIALSAILFRIYEWGLTPNRLAVSGGNILILTNLLFVAYRLLKSVKDDNETESVAKSITSFLPLYTIWAALVTFVIPLLFNFG